MIALDTNVIVRFLVRDDEEQARIVYARFKAAENNHERLFVPLLVVLELIWVLDSAYGMPRSEILGSIANLRQMPILRFETGDVVDDFLIYGGQIKVELDDLLIALSAQSSGCDGIITFDKKATRFSFFRMMEKLSLF